MARVRENVLSVSLVTIGHVARPGMWIFWAAWRCSLRDLFIRAPGRLNPLVAQETAAELGLAVRDEPQFIERGEFRSHFEHVADGQPPAHGDRPSDR